MYEDTDHDPCHLPPLPPPPPSPPSTTCAPVHMHAQDSKCMQCHHAVDCLKTAQDLMWGSWCIRVLQSRCFQGVQYKICIQPCLIKQKCCNIDFTRGNSVRLQCQAFDCSCIVAGNGLQSLFKFSISKPYPSTWRPKRHSLILRFDSYSQSYQSKSLQLRCRCQTEGDKETCCCWTPISAAEFCVLQPCTQET